MISGTDIVCVAFPNWEGDYMKSTVKLMEVLARENRVLYVDYEFTLKDAVWTFLGRQKAPVKRMFGFSPRLRELAVDADTRVHVLTPPPVRRINWMPYSWLYRFLLQVNGYIVRRCIRKAMRQLQFKQPVVINAFNPFFGVPLAGKLNEALLIYYCYDEIRAARWSKHHGAVIENTFIPLTDAVLTTSPQLFEERKKRHPNCFLVRNGVDFALFHQAVSLKPAPRPKPVIGFIGSLDERVDCELLTAVAAASPDLDYLFVGRVSNPPGVAELKALLNVKFLGPQQPSQLQEWLCRFDVWLIPFVKSDLTKGIYHLKINEYLAAGKPVVMTNFADLREFEKLAAIADTATEFLAAIRQSLASDSAQKQQERIEVAHANSWDGRVELISAVIERMLSRKD